MIVSDGKKKIQRIAGSASKIYLAIGINFAPLKKNLLLWKSQNQC